MITNRFPQFMSPSSFISFRLVAPATVAVLTLTMGDRVDAQTGIPDVAPSGSNVQSYDARQLELMRVREAAQKARASAQQAAMARSADRALEEEHIKGNVDRSIEYKQLKAQAAKDAQNSTAANAYQKVSSGEIRTWQNPDGGNVTIQKDVPQTFTESIPKADTGEAEESGGGIGGALRGALSWRPKIPFTGKKKEDPNAIPALPTFAPAESLGLGAVPAPPVQSAPEKNTDEKGGLKIPLIGGLFGGKDDAEDLAESRPAPAPAPASAEEVPYYQAPTRAAQSPAAVNEENDDAKPGFFARMNPFKGGDESDSVESDAEGYADLVESPGLPTSSSGNEASAGLFGPVGADGDSSSYIVTSDDREDKPGFFGRLFGGGDDDEPSKPRGGSASAGVYIVESDGAQLLKFGNSTVSSDSLPMPVGTVVRMTNAGEEWSSVQLPSGARGIMRNKTLRPATASEGSPSMFAHLDQPQYPTTARISRTRSATGASSEPQAPVYVPTPELPSADSSEEAPAGNSLLPPLPSNVLE